jgi:CheY-like chemotaxis protein
LESPDQAELSTHRGTKTILLVEDQPDVRKLVGSLLADLGYEVLKAADGEQALALAQQGSTPIHLVLTDLVMPGISGSELAARLAAIRPGLRTLYMSGYADRTPADRDAPAYQQNSIGKPFSPAALAAKVREVLDRAPPD